MLNGIPLAFVHTCGIGTMLLQTSLPETMHNPNRTIAGTPFIALGLRLFEIRTIYEILLKIGKFKNHDTPNRAPAL